MAWAERIPTSGRYRGLYRDATGRTRSLGKTYTHKAEAERLAAEAEVTARRQAWSDHGDAKRPWGEWADAWTLTRTVEPGTLITDASRRRAHLDARWARVPLGAIRRHDVQGWAADMARAGVGASVVQRCVALLSVSLSAAVAAGVLDANPAARIELPMGAQATERFLTRDEYAALSDAMPTSRDRLVLAFLTNTGLRWGEFAGLHAGRIDYARGVVRVVETFDGKTGQIKPYTKGRKIRPVPLGPELVEALLAHPAQSDRCGLVHRAGSCRGGLAITTAGGSVMRSSKWAATWHEAVANAGIGHVRVHDLRHTFCSWLIQAGISTAEVQALAGHQSIETTQRYTHLGATDQTAVLAALRGPAADVAAPLLPHSASLRVVR